MRFLLFLISVVSFANEFDPYIDRFMAAERFNRLPMAEPLRAKDFRVEFGSASAVPSYYGTVHGYCERGPVSVIKIMESSWRNADDITREMILFHELGHCVLNRPHRTTTINLNGYTLPASLMTPHMFNPKHYLGNRDYYLQELFVGALTQSQ